MPKKAKPKSRVTTRSKKVAGAAAKPRAKPTAKPKAKPALKSATRPGDWRPAALQRMRELILQADPAMVEERKWIKPSNPAGVAAWSHAGLVCTGETYKNYIKLTFFRGASLPDPSRLFNSSLDGNARRAIDIPEGAKIDPKAFKALVKAAVALNASTSKA
jgi:hypothetical protein